MGTQSTTVTTYDEHGNVVAIRTVTWETTPEQDNESALNDRLDQAIAALATLANGSGNLTAAQLTTEVRRLARATGALVRLQRRRLDDTTGT